MPNHGSSSISANDFLDQLVANFSLSQVAKEKEIDVYKIFCDFLQSLDGKGAVRNIKIKI